MFHLAIPVRDLKEAEEFYKNLGCTIGRKYPSHIVLDFYGHQLVCHQSALYDREAVMYPRHFGIILKTQEELNALWKRWQFSNFIFEEFFTRHKRSREEHSTFFIKDPSNNVIEFKWYRNKYAILG